MAALLVAEICIIGLALGALGLAAFGWIAAGRLTERREPDPPDSPDKHKLPFEDVTFESSDGLTLKGWWIGSKRKAKPRPTLILCPGHNGSMDADLKHVPWLWKAGYDLLLFDWRAHGKSEGEMVSMGALEWQDLQGAIAFLGTRDVPAIGLFGFSMGGAVVLRVAGQDSAGLVKAAVSDGGFARVESAIAGYFMEEFRLPRRVAHLAARVVQRMAQRRYGLNLADGDPLPFMDKMTCPLLLIHGARDPYVPVGDQDALYNAAGYPKMLWRLPEAGHREADVLRPEQYQERVLAFFVEHLGRQRKRKL